MTRAARFAICLAAGALLTFAASAEAESVHIHGVIQAFDGITLSIKADSGKLALVGIETQTRIIRSRIMTLSELKSGDHVATLAMQDANGNLHVQSVRVLSSSSTDDGQYKSDANSSRIITSGAVTAVSPAANTLSLTFHGASTDGTAPCTGRAPPGGSGCTGSAQLLIARGVPIIAIIKGDTNLLLPGAVVSASASADAAGRFTASGVSVERDGKPVQ